MKGPSALLQVHQERVYDLLNDREEVGVTEDNSGHVILDGLTEVRWLHQDLGRCCMPHLHLATLFASSRFCQSLQQTDPAAALMPSYHLCSVQRLRSCSCILPNFLHLKGSRHLTYAWSTAVPCPGHCRCSKVALQFLVLCADACC